MDMQGFAYGGNVVMLHNVALERLKVACAICTIMCVKLVDCRMDAVGSLQPHSCAHQQRFKGDIIEKER